MYNESSDDHPGVDWSDREKAASLATGGEGITEIHKASYGFRRAILTPLWQEIGPRRIDLYRSTQKLSKESAWQGPNPNPNKKNIPLRRIPTCRSPTARGRGRTTKKKPPRYFWGEKYRAIDGGGDGVRWTVL